MKTEPALFENFITTPEWLATMAFALSGVLAAARKRMDAVGVCMVAGIAAFGGGTLRDVLLDLRPFFWVKHSSWLWGVLTSAFGGVLRDIVCNDVPAAFADHQPYVVWSFVGGWLLLGLLLINLEPWVAILISAMVTTGLRLISVRLGWTLPAWDLR